MTALLSSLPASAAQHVDTRRTDAGGRNRRADHSEMRPRSWLPIRCPKSRAATPAVPLDRVCSADQPASFDAIVFPPATNGSDGPGTVIPRSRGGPTVVMWRSFRGNLAVPSRASQPQRDEACSLAQRELRNPGAGMRYAIRAASRDATTWCPRESG